MSNLYESIRLAVQELSYAGTLPYTFGYEFVINAVICALIVGPVFLCWCSGLMKSRFNSVLHVGPGGGQEDPRAVV